MKKGIALIALFMTILLMLTACSGDDGDGIIEIPERFFVTQTTEILGNPNRYLGRTIRLEGMFFTRIWPGTGEELHFVLRQTPGCCSPADPIGFELRLENTDPLPDNTWVEVTGVLELYVDVWQQNMLRLEVISLTAMTERGAEFVTQ